MPARRMAMILSEDRNTGKMESEISELEELQVFVFFHEHRQTYHEESYSEVLFAEVLKNLSCDVF